MPTAHPDVQRAPRRTGLEIEEVVGETGPAARRPMMTAHDPAELARANHQLRAEIAELKRVASQLRASDELYRAVVDSAADGIFVCKGGAIVYANRALVRMLGAESAGQVVGRSPFDILCPDCHPLIAGRLRLLTELGGPVPFVEDRFVRLDGTAVDAEVAATPFEDDGEVAIHVTARDLTDRKQAERARDRLVAILEATPDLVAISQADGPASYVNPAGRRLLGLGPDEVVELSAFRPPDSRRFVLEHAVPAAVRDGVWSGETELRDKNGRAIPVSQVIVAHRDARGRVEFISTIARDDTERRQATAEAHAAEDRMRKVVSSSPAVLYTLEYAGGDPRLTWASGNVAEMTGYGPDEVVRPGWWQDRVHPNDLPKVSAEFENILLVDDRLDTEYRLRHRDGSYRWVHNEMRLLRDRDGRPVEVVGSWFDVTERKQLEDQYRQAQKMEAIGRLAGGIAHDFNNLLTVIKGYGAFIFDHFPPTDPMREMVREVVAAGDRAGALTGQLLAFSRKALVEPKVLDLGKVVSDIDKMLRRIIGEDVQMTLVTGPAPCLIKADANQIEQVILNLAVNARDAMPRGGHLTVEVCRAELDAGYVQLHPGARPGPHVVLRISDTGYGMDPATMGRIWEPFFSTKGSQGTGIGLATVYGIVKHAGGHATVDSELGKGTTFRVYLPQVAAAPVSAGSNHETSSITKGSETILLAEDEHGVQSLARLVLKRCGYTVLDCRDGDEALDVAGKFPRRIDLLLTDVVMPRVGGRELADRLTRARPGVRVLYMSGYTDDAVVRHGLSASKVALLQKPFSPAALALRVRQVLDDAGR